MPIDEVTFQNCRISFAENAKPGIPAMENFAKPRCKLGLYLENVRRIRVEDVTIKGADGESLIASGYEDLKVEKLNEA